MFCSNMQLFVKRVELFNININTKPNVGDLTGKQEAEILSHFKRLISWCPQVLPCREVTRGLRVSTFLFFTSSPCIFIVLFHPMITIRNLFLVIYYCFLVSLYYFSNHYVLHRSVTACNVDFVSRHAQHELKICTTPDVQFVT